MLLPIMLEIMIDIYRYRALDPAKVLIMSLCAAKTTLRAFFI
jgi:hypothetical protein